jgi:hypothetical protein
MMLEGLEPEKTAEEQVIEDAKDNAELLALENEPVDMTPRERVEIIYGKGWTKDMDDEQVNELLGDILEDR